MCERDNKKRGGSRISAREKECRTVGLALFLQQRRIAFPRDPPRAVSPSVALGGSLKCARGMENRLAGRLGVRERQKKTRRLAHKCERERKSLGWTCVVFTAKAHRLPPRPSESGCPWRDALVCERERKSPGGTLGCAKETHNSQANTHPRVSKSHLNVNRDARQ